MKITTTTALDPAAQAVVDAEAAALQAQIDAKETVRTDLAVLFVKAGKLTADEIEAAIRALIARG